MGTKVGIKFEKLIKIQKIYSFLSVNALFICTFAARKNMKDMKKTMIFNLLLTVALAGNVAWAAIQNEKPMTKQTDGTYIVNTSTLCKARGYKGYTPLLVHFKQDKIVKVEALSNQETPKYYGMVKKNLFPKFIGMKASKAVKANVDGVTGATYTSKAVKENVKAAANYYKKNK